MAEQPKSSGQSKSSSKGGSGKLIGRIVVYSVLAILVVVGLLDFRIKSQAKTTGEAWREVQRGLDENDDFLQSQLDQYIFRAAHREIHARHTEWATNSSIRSQRTAGRD